MADDAPPTVVGRDEGESQAPCLGRRSWRDGVAGQPKRSDPGSSGKEAFDKSAAARTDDAVHADDLARSDRERDVADSGRVEVAHVEDRLYVLDRRLDRLTLDELACQLAADDGIDHRGPLGGSTIEHADVPPLPQDGDPICELEDFVHPVGDIDDGDAIRRHAPHDVEEARLFDVGQARRRLIHDQDSDVARDGDRDLG